MDVVGAEVELTVVGSQIPLKGKVYAYDEDTNTVAISQGLDFQIVQLTQVEAVKSLSAPKLEPIESPLPIDLQSMQNSFTKRALPSIPVSTRAARVYETVSKTMPTTWDGVNIRVLDVVTVAPPYKEAVSAERDHQASKRVQTIIDSLN
ncbi:hypothetical protein CANCADRAFT_45530 [Tortispora caseinolytica NRRL Y-17796]|uniref:AD domain-containing protein n=1 Tax=Tortispora caseinolytica NRRL Y-17796 TaxID=767744 RepID=A0A1E4TBM1_9ASCO|nr:hypothetical protein CANCADRAFT_45530 [Tortispora caseinolytica NRRL Y-17796]